MICFEILINGAKKYTIGSKNAEEFGANLIAAPQLDPPHISLDLSGFIVNEKKYPHELRWGSEISAIGDEITIKIIESHSPDVPQTIKYDEGVVDTDEQAQIMLCANCGKSHLESDKMLRGSKVTMCEECIKWMAEILAKEEKET